MTVYRPDLSGFDPFRHTALRTDTKADIERKKQDLYKVKFSNVFHRLPSEHELFMKFSCDIHDQRYYKSIFLETYGREPSAQEARLLFDVSRPVDLIGTRVVIGSTAWDDSPGYRHARPEETAQALIRYTIALGIIFGLIYLWSWLF
jgi:hypothetical protein